jgi:hypothetical protein
MQTYPIKLQVCIDINTYNKIKEYLVQKYDPHPPPAVGSTEIREIIQERFKMDEDIETATNNLNKVIQQYQHHLNEKENKINEQNNHIKHLEMKVKMLEGKLCKKK